MHVLPIRTFPFAKKITMAPTISDNKVGSFRRLRIMIVDDNHINLTMLNRLLTRKFDYLLDGKPVMVDSALKAIQVLQNEVFDCIFMDIQMPFLNGLEATLRIRNAEDGVLQANSESHIVAVTTAVGAEPEAAYRRAGMDGMIGKPVHFQDLEPYLNPLAAVLADVADVSDTDGLLNDDRFSTPSEFPFDRPIERPFYLPVDDSVRSPVDEICTGSNFEMMLRAQTRESLRNGRFIKKAREASLQSLGSDDNSTHIETVNVADARANDNDGDCIAAVEDTAETTATRTELLCASSGGEEASRQRDQISTSRPSHKRGLSLSRRAYERQIARELANIDDEAPRSNALAMSPSRTTATLARSQWTSPTSTSNSDNDGQMLPPWLGSIKAPQFLGRCAFTRDEEPMSSPSSSRGPSFWRRNSELSSTDSLGSDATTDVTTPSSETGPDANVSPLNFAIDQSRKAGPFTHHRSSSESTVASPITDQSLAVGRVCEPKGDCDGGSSTHASLHAFLQTSATPKDVTAGLHGLDL